MRYKSIQRSQCSYHWYTPTRINSLSLAPAKASRPAASDGNAIGENESKIIPDIYTTQNKLGLVESTP
jgi:hypothetical protein